MLPAISAGIKIVTLLLGVSFMFTPLITNDYHSLKMEDGEEVKYKINEEKNTIKIIYKKDKNGAITLVYDREGTSELPEADRKYIERIFDEVSKHNSISNKTKEIFSKIKNRNFFGWKRTD